MFPSAFEVDSRSSLLRFPSKLELEGEESFLDLLIGVFESFSLSECLGDSSAFASSSSLISSSSSSKEACGSFSIEPETGAEIIGFTFPEEEELEFEGERRTGLSNGVEGVAGVVGGFFFSSERKSVCEFQLEIKKE